MPVYKLVLANDQDGVQYVSLVDKPAIERCWQMFKADSKESGYTAKFKADGERRIISGPLMIADVPIYRNDGNGQEYFVVFDKSTIEQLVCRFMKNKLVGQVNQMHGSPVYGVYMIESFIIDESRGIKSPEGFGDPIPEGSWFGSFKVEDDVVWNEFIKTGIFKGFSIEGLFTKKPVNDEFTDEAVIDFLVSNCRTLNN